MSITHEPAGRVARRDDRRRLLHRFRDRRSCLVGRVRYGGLLDDDLAPRLGTTTTRSRLGATTAGGDTTTLGGSATIHGAVASPRRSARRKPHSLAQRTASRLGRHRSFQRVAPTVAAQREAAAASGEQCSSHRWISVAFAAPVPSGEQRAATRCSCRILGFALARRRSWNRKSKAPVLRDRRVYEFGRSCGYCRYCWMRVVRSPARPC